MPEMDSLKQRAYEYIRTKLMEGDAPAGTFMSDRILAREMGISRTPVREAVRLLESERLIVRKSRSGTVVASPTAAQIDEAYDLRLMLETYALARAVPIVSENQIRKLKVQNMRVLDAAKAMRAAIRRGAPVDHNSLHRADLEFHVMLLRFAQCPHTKYIIENQRILTALDRPNDRGGAVDWPFLAAAVTVREHDQIVRAIARRDVAAACDGMIRHIRSAKNRHMAALYGRDASAEGSSAETGIQKVMQSIVNPPAAN